MCSNHPWPTRFSNLLRKKTHDTENSPDSTVHCRRLLNRVNRGWVSDEELDAFIGAGFNKQHVLEVVVGVAHKVISTYANHIAKTPLDTAFKRNAWQKTESLADAI